jgi:Holliday junction resolvase RusA-like endonuclease
MMPVTFTAWGVPQPKGSTRAFIRGGRAIVTSDNPSLAKWESAVRFAAAKVVEQAGHRLFEGPVLLRVTFHVPRPKSVSPRVRPFPTTRPDLSKIIRAIEDPLTGVLWRDDAQVIAVEAAKFYTNGPAKAVITVSQVLQLSDFPSAIRGAQ